MERPIRRLAFAVLLLFGALAVNVNYIQVIAADELANNEANKRLLIQEYEIDRGEMIAADGRTVLARSIATDDPLKYLRRYPEGSLYAHVTGFLSFIFGRAELEDTYNDFLSGRAEELFPQRLIDEILGRDQRGASLVLTIEPELQRAASEALGERQGAVAAVDPRTGAVLALVSNPTYDPNPLASHDPDVVRNAWDGLINDPDKPLLSNANDQTFPPGSSFKIVTAAAALENGIRPETTFPNPSSLDLPQTDEDLDNFGGDHCLGGASQVSLAEALQISCNVTFGEIGLQLGADRLVEQARRFGFGEEIGSDIPFAEGNIPGPETFLDRLPAIAFSAIGQQDVQTNPLHMALIAASIGNDGVMMTPKLVREVRDPTGRVIRGFEPEPFRRVMEEGNAAALTTMMQGVVSGGTGTAAQIPGVTVAGKTGTAQNPNGNPHAWFVSFAPAEAPLIAVAVVVLNGGDLGSEATGGAIAAPIARQVLSAALTG
jgi:peptidoglycan glycosyltransferase